MINKLRKFFKKKFCKHNYKKHTFSYGGGVIHEEWLECVKCKHQITIEG